MPRLLLMSSCRHWQLRATSMLATPSRAPAVLAACSNILYSSTYLWRGPCDVHVGILVKSQSTFRIFKFGLSSWNQVKTPAAINIVDWSNPSPVDKLTASTWKQHDIVCGFHIWDRTYTILLAYNHENVWRASCGTLMKWICRLEGHSQTRTPRERQTSESFS